MGFGKFYRWSWLGWPNLRCILWGRQTTRLWNVYSYLDSLIALKVSRQFDFVNIEVGKSKIFVPLRPVGSSLSCKNNIPRGHGARIFSNACDVYPTNFNIVREREPKRSWFESLSALCKNSCCRIFTIFTPDFVKINSINLSNINPLKYI